jgi:hypothetical protein
MNCNFCNKLFSSKSSLNNHQKTAKYCLKLQDNKEISNFICEYCKKLFTSKQNLNIHFLNCKDRAIENIKKDKDNKEIYYKEQIIRLEKEKYKLEITNDKLEKLNDKLEIELDKIKEENNLLKGQLLVLDKDHQIITNLAQLPKNTTTNNTATTNNILSIQSSLDFNNIDRLKNIINEKYNDKYLFDGQKGIAKFAVDHVLTDENGNLSYICTDPSRHIFKYKDSSGDIRKDIEAKKITNFLIDGGIQNKTSDMFMKLWTDKEGNIDGEKCSELLVKADAMLKLKNDNSVFKKELVCMTTKN